METYFHNSTTISYDIVDISEAQVTNIEENGGSLESLSGERSCIACTAERTLDLQRTSLMLGD
eukprot:161809-Amphidinium_carterae.1